MGVIVVLAGALILWAVWTLQSILTNYHAAKRIGLPIVMSPVSMLNPFWTLAIRFLPVLPLLRALPFGLGHWAGCAYLGWTFDDKYARHAELGSAFTLVTPNGNEVWIADPEAAHVVMSRRKEYVKPAIMYDPLNVFGPNLDSVEGDDWQRHRRLTAPSFNENVSSSVWDEALRQAKDMLQSWIEKGPKGTPDTTLDTSTLALHVLSGAGFGIFYQYGKGLQHPPSGHSIAYRDALHAVLRNIVTFIIVPQSFMVSRFAPAMLRKLGHARQEFQTYMEEMLSSERSQMSAAQESRPRNLLTALVRASEEAKQSPKEDLSGQGLTDDEIFGNIFIYNLAGHETTANTLAFAIVLLAAEPEWQEWIAEEITQVLGDESTPQSWKYEQSFPRLGRCLAVMYEVLRLYGSNVFLPKAVGPLPASLRIDGKNHTIPPGTFTITNMQAVHTSPHTWGPDPLTWRPSRWLASPASEPTRLIEPPPGTFVPWAGGPRICPGKKLAQVEFVAVLALLFRGQRVRPVLREGESPEMARRRLRNIVEDSTISAITLQMRRPKDAVLEWRKADAVST